MASPNPPTSPPEDSANHAPQGEKARWLALGAGPHFGAVIALLRDLKGETRAWLAKASGRSYSQIRGLELGDRWPSDKVLTSIAGPLQCTPGNLIETRDDLLRRLEQAPPDMSQTAALEGWLAGLPHRFGGELDVEPLLPGAQGPQVRPDMLWDLGDGRTAVFEVKTGTGKTAKILAAAQQRSATGDTEPWNQVYTRLYSQLARIDAALSREPDDAPPATRTPRDWLATDPDQSAPTDSSQLEDQVAKLTSAERNLVGAYIQGLLDSRRPPDPQAPANT